MLLGDVPMCLACLFVLVTTRGVPLLLLLTTVGLTLTHALIYGCRAAVVIVAGELRRPSTTRCICCSAGDTVTLLASSLQKLLVLALAAVYVEGAGKAGGVGLPDGSGGALLGGVALIGLLFIVSVIINWALVISFLNHAAFSHAGATCDSRVTVAVCQLCDSRGAVMEQSCSS